MNLADPQIQKAIIDIAESSESSEVAEACKLVIADHLGQGDTEIESPREVILTAIECVKKASDEATESRGQALQELADQAQELKMGYEASADEADTK
tara:strand:- start:6640 stop:6930 length:291 start_codon:yes stop_codon:yes gene_type:complete